jgi:uncharacterized linocin/CFP29 family protein
MTQTNPQVPWTDEQWARVTQVIQEEASRARVAATFLPLLGPLPADTDFVRADRITYFPDPNPNQEHQRMEIEDRRVIQLATLQVKVSLRGAQMADPELTSALAMFRRAANVIARLEDAMVFNGQEGVNKGPKGPHVQPHIYDVHGGEGSDGLVAGTRQKIPSRPAKKDDGPGEHLVTAISDSIFTLESKGHVGPFAVALGQDLFTDATTPSPSLVLPQDRIVPFLGGGSMVRTSTLPANEGVVVALGGAPVELVVATDISLGFLQVTTHPNFVFRVYEKVALRIKELEAIVRLVK